MIEPILQIFKTYSFQQILSLFILNLLLILPYVWYWIKKRNINYPAILLAILSGLITVLISLYFEKHVTNLYTEVSIRYILWAFIEEFIKLIALLIFIFIVKIDKRSIITYGVLIALGFSLFENFFFMFQNISDTTIPTNFYWLGRYMGATNLHVLATGIISLSIANIFVSKYSKASVISIPLYFIFSVMFHFEFNQLILGSSGNQILGIIILIITLVMFIWTKLIYDSSVQNETFKYKKLLKESSIFLLIAIVMPIGIIITLSVLNVIK